MPDLNHNYYNMNFIIIRVLHRKVDQDHYMAPDIVKVVRLLQEGKVYMRVIIL